MCGNIQEKHKKKERKVKSHRGHIAELLVQQQLACRGIKTENISSESGSGVDMITSNGDLIEVKSAHKFRKDADTPNVGINNHNFDFLVVVLYPPYRKFNHLVKNDDRSVEHAFDAVDPNTPDYYIIPTTCCGDNSVYIGDNMDRFKDKWSKLK